MRFQCAALISVTLALQCGATTTAPEPTASAAPVDIPVKIAAGDLEQQFNSLIIQKFSTPAGDDGLVPNKKEFYEFLRKVSTADDERSQNMVEAFRQRYKDKESQWIAEGDERLEKMEDGDGVEEPDLQFDFDEGDPDFKDFTPETAKSIPLTPTQSVFAFQDDDSAPNRNSVSFTRPTIVITKETIAPRPQGQSWIDRNSHIPVPQPKPAAPVASQRDRSNSAPAVPKGRISLSPSLFLEVDETDPAMKELREYERRWLQSTRLIGKFGEPGVAQAWENIQNYYQKGTKSAASIKALQFSLRQLEGMVMALDPNPKSAIMGPEESLTVEQWTRQIHHLRGTLQSGSNTQEALTNALRALKLMESVSEVGRTFKHLINEWKFKIWFILLEKLEESEGTIVYEVEIKDAPFQSQAAAAAAASPISIERIEELLGRIIERLKKAKASGAALQIKDFEAAWQLVNQKFHTPTRKLSDLELELFDVFRSSKPMKIPSKSSKDTPASALPVDKPALALPVDAVEDELEKANENWKHNADAGGNMLSPNYKSPFSPPPNRNTPQSASSQNRKLSQASNSYYTSLLASFETLSAARRSDIKYGFQSTWKQLCKEVVEGTFADVDRGTIPDLANFFAFQKFGLKVFTGDAGEIFKKYSDNMLYAKWEGK